MALLAKFKTDDDWAKLVKMLDHSRTALSQLCFACKKEHEKINNIGKPKAPSASSRTLSPANSFLTPQKRSHHDMAPSPFRALPPANPTRILGASSPAAPTPREPFPVPLAPSPPVLSEQAPALATLAVVDAPPPPAAVTSAGKENANAGRADLEAKRAALSARDAELAAKRADLEAKRADFLANLNRTDFKAKPAEAKQAEARAKQADKAKHTDIDKLRAEHARQLEAKQAEIAALQQELEVRDAKLTSKRRKIAVLRQRVEMLRHKNKTLRDHDQCVGFKDVLDAIHTKLQRAEDRAAGLEDASRTPQPSLVPSSAPEETDHPIVNI